MNPYDRVYSRDKSSYRGAYRENSKSDKFSSSASKDGEHPLNYLTEAGNYSDYGYSAVGGQFSNVNPTEAPSLSPSRHYSYQNAFPRRVSRQHDVVVIAVNRELKTYSQMVVDTLNRYANEKGHVYLKDYLKEQQEQEPKSRPFHYRPLKVLQIALADEGLVELFVLDFINKGYLFAIILNDANRRHGSCTLRILHSDQEHRNMPLADAMGLLFNDFSRYLLAESEYLSSVSSHPPPPPACHFREATKQRRSFPLPRHRERDTERRKRRRSSRTSSYSSSRSNRFRCDHRASAFFLPSPIAQNRHRQHATSFAELPDPDDPNFLAPSKRISALLRMLADSRILSAAELDEIASFVAERKARLNREASMGDSSSVELKARILQTIYPTIIPAPPGALNEASQSHSGQQQQQQQQFSFPSGSKALLSRPHPAIQPLTFTDPGLSNPMLSFNSTSNVITIPTSAPPRPSTEKFLRRKR